MKRILLLCFFFALVACTVADKDFCFGWECPEFEARQEGPGFQVRRYESASWASVKLTFSGTVDDTYLHAITEGSAILKAYRLGNNNEEVELNHTFPMRIMILNEDSDSDSEKKQQINYVISYYIHSSARENPPSPLDDRVMIETIDAHTVVVRSFSHGAMSWSHHTEPEFARLIADIDAAGLTGYVTSPKGIALYDRRANHTEVFLVIPNPANVDFAPPSVRDKPDFCGDKDCPNYDVTRSTSTYDIRQYSEANWALVNVTLEGDVGDNYLKAAKVAWPLLLAYRKKGNSKQVDMAHTVPILVLVDERKSTATRKIASFIFGYFIPFKYQSDVPQPTDKRVCIRTVGSISVGVRSFPGIVLSWDKQVKPELHKLRQDLHTHHEVYHRGICIFSQYHILKLKDRHNEAAFIIDEGPQTDPLKPLNLPDALGESAAPAVQEKPDFCGDKDCPDFEVTRSTGTYDIRRYAQANWAVVNVTLKGEVGENYDKAWKAALPVLHIYRNKGNVKKAEMAHTVPLLIGADTRLCTDDNKFVSFLFAYFIPLQFQDDVPEPIDKRVTIMSLGPVSLAVRVFSGFVYSWDKQVKVQLDTLSQDLDSHGEKYEDGLYGFAQYSLVKPKYHHNEVALWITEEGAPAKPLPAVSVPAVSAEVERDPPDFCGDRDCPNFDVVRSTRTYDVRRYEQANWAFVNVTLEGDIAENYPKALKEAAPVLLTYRAKGNKKRAELGHTVPMLVGVDERFSTGSNKVASFYFAYFIPFKYQDDVPEPLDVRVHIIPLGPVTLAVRSFSGVVLSWNKVDKELKKLCQDLQSHDEKYYKGLVGFAQYSHFLKPHHNEVAFWLKEDAQAADPFSSISVRSTADIENESSDNGFIPPYFCREYDCPEFDVLRSGSTFEVRKYTTAKWLTYNITASDPYVKDDDFKQAIATAMALIDGYCKGQNEHGLLIPHTVPARVFAHERWGSQSDEVKYVVAFYIPVKYQSDTPCPLDGRLTVRELSEMTVAVRAFRDASQDWDTCLLPQIDQLAVDLHKAGEDYVKDHTFVSYYNFPSNSTQDAPQHRPYSEIWLIVKE